MSDSIDSQLWVAEIDRRSWWPPFRIVREVVNFVTTAEMFRFIDRGWLTPESKVIRGTCGEAVRVKDVPELMLRA